MKYLESLNQKQKEAALQTTGPLLIIAGAGAGKTKTITHRIAHLIANGVPADSILALTFTNKAAGEMRHRVRVLLEQMPEANVPLSATADGRIPFIATFHALGVRLLREFSAQVHLPRSFVIWDRDDSLRAVKQGLKDLGQSDQYQPRQILSAISRKKGDGVSVEAYAEKARYPFERTVLEVWTRYENALTQEKALDFDDLLIRTLQLLHNDHVREHLNHRWHYITIDEYQDTNTAQYEIARLLAGSRNNICVVGDIDQNIYSWRGADITHLLQFEETYPNARLITLEQNYRSTKNILEAANAVIVKNVRRKEKHLFTENPEGELIEVFGGMTEANEAQFVVNTVAELIDAGVSPQEIAVLYRENFQSRALEEAFLHAGVPYRILGVRFFERKEVKDVLSYIRFALNPNSRADLARIIGTPARGIGAATLARMLEGKEDLLGTAAKAKLSAFRKTIEKIHAVAVAEKSSAVVKQTAELSGINLMYKGSGEEGHERLENIRELSGFASRFDHLPVPEGIERLLEEAALASEQDSLEQKVNAVSLMTVHASKGLEFDAVFVTGLEHGLFPSVKIDDENRDPEEERRLFYVAMTRAKHRLYLTYAMSRMKYGTREFTVPSEFLDDIDHSLLKEQATPKRTKGLLDFYEEETIR